MLHKFIQTVFDLVSDIKKQTQFTQELKNYPSVQRFYFIYKTFNKNTEYKTDFLQFVIKNYKNLNISLTDEDLDFIIDNANLKYKNHLGENSFKLSLSMGNSNDLPFTAWHFNRLAQGADYCVAPSNLMGLHALFQHSTKLPFSPTPEDISLILKNLVEQYKDNKNELNPLLFALCYEKIGQTFLQEEHYDYLFEHFDYNVEKLQISLPVNPRTQIINNKAKYDAIKQKNYLETQLNSILSNETLNISVENNTKLKTKKNTHKI